MWPCWPFNAQKKTLFFAFASSFYQAFPSIGCSHNHKGKFIDRKTPMSFFINWNRDCRPVV
ncbi:hypothetical protein CLOSTMETH_03929 [[Clostridium] methylpentosum DSM 5476]|uniref:Uncharacterized protein n=1 Tax=[Clostridium] methylpentosum DSM 5476 TaxID=537013 RepID=C0EJ77_9FIRM|nr:hypothetical protein CLOSTMETH_03929 [[Clostridium] methylpentosum DSM 5476]